MRFAQSGYARLVLTTERRARMGRGLVASLLRVAAVTVVVVSGCTLPAQNSDGVQVTVDYVVDGDTFNATSTQAGEEMTVRILGIDAPEVGHDGEASQCGGEAATAALGEFIGGRMATLVSDPVADDVDRYGRRLAYVMVDGTDIGARLVDRGYAGAWYPSSEPEPVRYADYRSAEQQARSQGRGAWASCGALGRA